MVYLLLKKLLRNMKEKFRKKCYHFLKRKGKYFYTFNHFHIVKSKISQSYYYDPQSAGINMQSPQSRTTPRRLTLTM